MRANRIIKDYFYLILAPLPVLPFAGLFSFGMLSVENQEQFLRDPLSHFVGLFWAWVIWCIMAIPISIMRGF